MRPLEIEQWVIRVADQVATSAHSEDSLVELKATWPEQAEAARRIAAHANSARGADILWIIGIDEEHGICGAELNELSNWFAGVRKHFDDVAPDVVDLNVRIADKTVVALLFRTDRAPYVVRNPNFGKPNGGAISREIPWREGRSTRTATRQDILRLIAPLVPLPEIECLNLAVRVCKEWTDNIAQVHMWHLEGRLYIAPKPGTTVTIPSHRVKAQGGPQDQFDEFEFQSFQFYVPYKSTQNPVSANHAGVTIVNPGLVFFSASRSTSPRSQDYPTELLCTLTLPAVGALVPSRVQALLSPSQLANEEVAKWVLSSNA